MDTIEKKMSLKKRALAFFASVAVLAGGVIAGVQADDDPATTGKVQVEVFDEANAPLAGATLEIVDANGNSVLQFTSDGTAQEFTLPVGNYKLRQISAPDGYTGVTDEASFEVKFSEKVTTTTITQATPLPTSVSVHNESFVFDGIYDMPAGGINATAIFCVDASYKQAPTGNYNAQQLGGVNGLSRDQLLRILYVGWAGNAKNYGSQFRAANDFTAAEQFWIATQYAIISYTNGAGVAEEYYGNYLGPNKSLANQIKAAANDTSIVIPDGSIAYLYTSSGNQPFVAASFPVVSQHVEQNGATQVKIVNFKNPDTPPPPASDEGTVVIKKVDENGNLLAGAKFQILNASGTVVKEFTSDGTAQEFTLPVGKYVLQEVEAPEGYQKEGNGRYEFEIKPGTEGPVTPGQTTSVEGTTTAGGILRGTGTMEIAGSAFAFCVNPQAPFLWEKPGTYSYSVLGESQVDLAAFGTKTPVGARGWVNSVPSNVGLTAAKMEQVKKVLWATYDFMKTGDMSADHTGIIKDKFGSASFAQAGVYWAAGVAIAEIVSPGSVDWGEVGDNSSTGNTKALAQALIAAAQGQSAYFAAYSSYSIVYLQSADPATQNLITPGSESTEVTVTNTPKEDTPEGEITIEKYDDSGNLLKGAHLQILDSEGNVVEDFTSDGTSMKFKLPVGEYVLHEVSAPAGYTVAPDKSFTVIDDSKKTKTVNTVTPPEDLPGPTVYTENAVFSDDQGRSVIGYCINSFSYFSNAKNLPYYAYEFTPANVGEFAGTFKNFLKAPKRSNTAENQNEVYWGILRVLYAGLEGGALKSDIEWVDKWRATQYVLTYMADERLRATTDPWGGKKWSKWVRESSNPAGVEAYAQSLMNAWSDSSLDAEIKAAGYKAVIYYGGYQPNVSVHFGTNTTTVEEWQEKNGTVAMIDFRVPTTIGTTATGASGLKIANAGDPAQGPVTVTIQDAVAYTNAYVGRDYVLKGQLVLKSTGKVLDTSYTTFKPVVANSVALVNFEFTADAALQEKLRNGDAVVVFEELYQPGDSLRDENGVVMTGEQIEASGKADELFKDAQLEAEHKDINDGGQTVTFPEIGTTATDAADGDHFVPAGKVTIVDEVKYTNLIPGKEYTVSGTLHDKATGEALTVEGASATKTFTAEAANGSVTIEFTIDTSALVGKKLVAFEEVSYEGVTVAVHADINDENQTVEISEKPVIGTTATSADGGKEVENNADVVVVDTVAYANLKPGKTYTLKGKLVKKSDESVVAEAEATFVPQEANGETTMEFTFDASQLGGTSVVAYEYLFLGDVKGQDVNEQSDEYVTKHEDITDEGQTVYVKEKPEIEKYVNQNVHEEIDLSEVFTYDVLAYVTKDADKVVITDTLNDDLQFVSAAGDVTVVDLGTENDHTPYGTVAEDGTAVENADVVIDGQTLTVTIDPATAERGHWVKVTFDAKIADGKTIDDLKYAKVEKNDPVLTDEQHEGVPNEASYKVYVGNEGKYEDESNTVTVKPAEIGTLASVKGTDGDKVTFNNSEVTIVDAVLYRGLEAGKEYTVKGKLVTKSSNGATVVATGETTFTASATGKGVVTMEFTFDASELAGDSVVAFEYLYRGDVVGKDVSEDSDEYVTKHEDINDEDQTVSVEEEKPAIEKYVNKNVHKDVQMDEVFTYDVLAYVTKDADKVVVTDTLVDDLQFVSAAGDVTVVDLGAANNHKPNGTVAEAGTAVAAEATIDGQTLTVTIDPATAERGHWVKVTFDAKIKDGLQITDLDYAAITENAPVLTDEQHEGVPNKASYEIFVDNKGRYALESNTVTVTPKETKPGEKAPEIGTTATDNADGDKELAVDSDVTVKDVVEYKNLMPNQTYTLKGQLVVKGSDGQVVVATGEATFVADASGNGAVDVFFNFNTAGLDGKELVAYEYLFRGDVVGEDIDLSTVTKDSDARFEVKHADDNDVAQTVKVAEKTEETVPPTPTPTPERSVVPKVTVRPTVKLPVTGLPRTGSAIGVAGLAALLLIGGGLMLRRRND